MTVRDTFSHSRPRNVVRDRLAVRLALAVLTVVS